jgi:hypothetical protein
MKEYHNFLGVKFRNKNEDSVGKRKIAARSRNNLQCANNHAFCVFC